MTTADYALIVSMLSLVLSLGSFIWAIWSKFIHPKPKIKVTFSVMNLIDANGLSAPFLGLYVTNFGPTETTLKSVVCRSRKPGWRHWFWDRWQWAMLNSVHSMDAVVAGIWPSPAGLPAKLAVGEEFANFLVFNHSGFRDHDIRDVGFTDVFGRNHWASRKSVRQVRKRVREGQKP
jgi:hypothetical protein